MANKVQAGSNGQAAAGLSVGTVVGTQGGDYIITGVNADGSYQSAKYTEAGSNGKAAAGQSVGTVVGTKGGNYQITGINADGTYQSQKLGGTATSNATAPSTGGASAGTGSTIPTTYNSNNDINYAGYDANYDYQARMNEIINGAGNYDANGNFVPGAWGQLQRLEAARNAKLVDMGRAGEQTSIYGTTTWTPEQIDYNRNVYGSALAPQSNDSIGADDAGIVRVGKDGKAPKGLSVGTLVSTEGGTYRITAVNADGTYQSERIGGASTTDPTKNKTNGTQQTPSDTGSTGSQLNDMQSLLDQWQQMAIQQANGQIDYATQQSIAELQRALDDAQAQYQQQQNQTALDEAKALDNSALYAEARGDKGGIGQAQYNQIMADALKSKQAIQTAQTQLSTDTARQIADLRAQGEFEKADKLLEISQEYLSKAIQLQQWQAEYNLSYAQFQAQLDQWQQEYELSVANVTGTYKGQATLNKQSQLSSVASALLSAGIMPNSEQLAAMGMTQDQAQQYVTAVQLASKASGSGNGTQSSEVSDAQLTKTMTLVNAYLGEKGSLDVFASSHYKELGYANAADLKTAYKTTYNDQIAVIEGMLANIEGYTYDTILNNIKTAYITEADRQKYLKELSKKEEYL